MNFTKLSRIPQNKIPPNKSPLFILQKIRYNFFMRILRRYLIGIALGILAALILPFENSQWNVALSFVTEIIVRIGRYTLMPLLFFSGITAMRRLRSDKLLTQTSILTFAVIIASSILLALLGFISIVIVRNFPHIPITTEHANEIASLDIQDLLRTIFPYSAFSALDNGAFLLPTFVFAMVVGAGCCIHQSNLKPMLSLLDCASELFYNISTVFVEFFSMGFFFLTCAWTVQFKSIIKSGIFLPLIVMLSVEFIVVVGLIYPLIIKLTCRNGKPLKILYASIVPFLVAFFSGDTNLALSSEIQMGNENLGIKQRTSGFSFPLFSIFARGGNALVIIISFVIILHSYSDLNIELSSLLFISVTAFALSFLLGGIPVGGTFTALTILCTIYGRGMENGFLLFMPAAAIIGSFAALFDAATAMFGCYIVAHNTKATETRRP